MSSERRPPTTRSGEAWRRAEQLTERLAESGDTPRIVKGLVGLLGLLAVIGGAIWLAVSAVRWLLS